MHKHVYVIYMHKHVCECICVCMDVEISIDSHLSCINNVPRERKMIVYFTYYMQVI